MCFLENIRSPFQLSNLSLFVNWFVSVRLVDIITFYFLSLLSIPAGKKTLYFSWMCLTALSNKRRAELNSKNSCFCSVFFFCDSNIKEADTKFKTLYCNKLQCIFWYPLCDLFFFRFLSFSFHLGALIPPADIFNTSKRKDCNGEVLNF